MIRAVAILFLFMSCQILGQEIKLGLVLGTNLYQKITVDQTSYSPSQSYITFVGEDPNKLINSNNILNAFHIGTKTSVLYKKLSFNLEPQYFYKRSDLYFDYPISIDWVLVEKGFRLPLYFTYKLFKKPKSLYLILGLTYTNTRHWDFQNPTLDFNFSNKKFSNGNPIYGYDLFEDYLYSQKGYWNILLGFGKKMKKIDLAVRFQSQFNTKHLAFDPKTFQIEWSITKYILSSKDITQKHFLYVE